MALVPRCNDAATVAARVREANAVKKGRVGKRVSHRAAGKATGPGLGKLFR